MSSSRTLVLALFALTAASCGSSGAAEPPMNTDKVGLDPGYRAPNFTLAEYRKQPIELEEALKGNNVVVLNFWATWCRPCLIELPLLDRLQREYGERGFQVLAVNVDQNQKAMELYLEKNEFSFPILPDVSQDIHRKYAIRGLPSNFILDGDGRIIDVIRGYTPLLEPVLKRLIEESEAESAVGGSSPSSPLRSEAE